VLNTRIEEHRRAVFDARERIRTDERVIKDALKYIRQYEAAKATSSAQVLRCDNITGALNAKIAFLRTGVNPVNQPLLESMY